MSATTAVSEPATTTRRWPARSYVVLAGPLLVLASELVAPRQPEGLSGREEAAFLLAHDERFLVSGLLGLLAAVALVCGFVVLALSVSGRGRVLMRTAAVLGVLGGTGLAIHMALMLASRDVLLDDAAAYAATDAATTGVIAVIAVVGVVIGINLAVVLLGVAGWRTGRAGWWLVVVGVLALVGDFSPTSWNTVLFALFATVVFAVHARALRDLDR